MRKNGLPSSLLERMWKDRELADAIGEALTYASTEKSLRNQLESLDLSVQELNAICGLPFASKVFKGYEARSLKALQLLLDSFDDPQVMTLTDAERASGLLDLRLNRKSKQETFLEPYLVYDPTCNNPVVLRSMGRMRRIINAIIKLYGVPNEIHIELGRELKYSAKEKDKIRDNNKDNRKNNEIWSKTISESLGIAPEEVRGKLLRKYALWKEQGGKDVYTGDKIEFDRMIREDHYCEIDHILPYSRTCDDSKANKVLVLAKNNQDKGPRTPYEWMTQDASAPNWDEYRARVLELVKNPKKRRYLLNTDLAEGDHEAKFLDRNLNDTRYMSRAVKTYLEETLLFPEDGRKQHVIAVAGGATANLRWVWGLNTGKGNTKDRSDNRHHAVDAAVIAACSESTVQKVAKARSLGREMFKVMRRSRLADTQPWPGFADEVLAKRESVIPTRMVSHGVTGRVFEDTLYSFEGEVDGKEGYGLLKAKNKQVKKGNFCFVTDKSVHLVDGLAFLRLWLDPTARPNGKVKGKYYAEPVYYADIPSIKNGTYVPRACKIHVARTKWEPIPDSVLKQNPIVLYRGDVLSIDGNIGRYWAFDINKCGMKVHDLKTNKELVSFPTIGKLGVKSNVFIIQEDILGHCYANLE